MDVPDRVRAVLSDAWSRLERMLPATATRMVREHRRVALALGVLMLLMLVGACVQVAKPRPKPKLASTTTTSTEDDEFVEADIAEPDDPSSEEPAEEPSESDDAPTPTPVTDTKSDTPDQSSTARSNRSSTPVVRPAPRATLSVTPPSADGNFGWYIRVPSLRLGSNTDGNVLYRWDSGRWTVSSGRVSVPSGNHKLSYYAKDSRGRTSSVQAKSLKVDVGAPSAPGRIRLTAIDTRSATIAWDASTDRVSAVRRYHVYDGRGVIVGDTRVPRFTVSGLLPGQRITLSVQAEDFAGNRSSRGTGLSASALMPDTTAPRTTHSLSPKSPDGGDGWYVTTPTVTLKRSEAGATSWWWDSGARTAYSAPFDAPEGKHTLHYRSKDAAGNTEATRSAEVRVDTTAPSIPVLSSAIASSTVTLTWTAAADAGSGVSRYDLYASSVASAIATFAADASLTATYPVGANTGYYVRAADIAGNLSQPSATASGTAVPQMRRRMSRTTSIARTATSAPPRTLRTLSESGGGAPVSTVPAGSGWSMAALAAIGSGLLAFQRRRRTA